MNQFSLSFQAETLTVKQVTARLRRTLREQYGNLIVRGEISGLKSAASGHLYFNLKEEDTVLPSVLYRQSARLLKFPVRDGLLVEARGAIDVYEPRGAYQFLIEHMEPVGAGALQQAFEDLKRKLAAEGLFEQARKKALPRYARRIGIVTSPTGAVIQDMLNVLERRSPGLEIRVYPALVQGTGSTEQVCEGLAYFSETGWADVVIVARGGGSLEDLWTFNEEAVARAIAASSVPVISAVGHETDFTIADFVADLRAPTPSAAAELVAPALASVLERIDTLERSLERSMQYKLAVLRQVALRLGVDRPQALLQRKINQQLQRTDDAEAAMQGALRKKTAETDADLERLANRLRECEPSRRIAQMAKRWEYFSALIQNSMDLRLAATHLRFGVVAAQLAMLSPKATLERGFAIVRDAKGRPVRDAADVKARAKLRIEVAKGTIEATAKGN